MEVKNTLSLSHIPNHRYVPAEANHIVVVRCSIGALLKRCYYLLSHSVHPLTFAHWGLMRVNLIYMSYDRLGDKKKGEESGRMCVPIAKKEPTQAKKYYLFPADSRP